jgi:ABC-type transport system involved in multi-copper enzyme maturation permease subunit
MIFNGVPLTEITIWINLIALAIYSIVIVIIGTVIFKRFGKA